MKFLIVLAVVLGIVSCQKGGAQKTAGKQKTAAVAPKAAANSAAKPAPKSSPSSAGDSSSSGKYVWDYLKPALDAAEVAAILQAKSGDYPTLAEIPDDSSFDCSSKKQPGFYADVPSKCQVFHRCDVNGNKTSYLCVNSTLFNQITLVCDYFFNVDCEKFAEQEDFANSRLYTDKDIFDTPPADYVAPQSKPANASDSGDQSQSSATTKKAAGGAAATKKPAGGAATTKKAAGGAATTKKVAGGKAATTAAPEEETTAAQSEDTTSAAASEDTTSAAGGEDTTSAAGGEDTTAAAEGDTTAAASE
ncbi:uncharacterized protein LOC129594666 [Paramacrobiotus metropolitanus]|uniref:uncharacterized protein LOC129594666 n=1 Tax=Paramacrobiotus metropolitanus TaxID=2943436 RepID=UPI002445A234|nr:uncharacterized protein LOC129594666 [Paramacrobiotus metropolitanus]